jgi:hypothetical protein
VLRSVSNRSRCRGAGDERRRSLREGVGARREGEEGNASCELEELDGGGGGGVSRDRGGGNGEKSDGESDPVLSGNKTHAGGDGGGLGRRC